MVQQVEFGLDTFGDVTVDASGETLTTRRSCATSSSRRCWPTRSGIDFIGIGEHHRDDFAVSSPEVVLAAIAAKTERIHLGSAVTVLSSDDPVRVFERFATLDALSNGRAELIVGRGSFTESFPLFGLDLHNYEELFEEKLELFAELLKEKPVTWSGRLRAPLQNQEVFPKTEGGSIPTWIGVGGSPESVVRAANYGLPLTLAIIGGSTRALRARTSDLYRRALAQFGHRRHCRSACTRPATSPRPTSRPPRSCGRTTSAMNSRIGAERGWGPMTRDTSSSHETDRRRPLRRLARTPWRQRSPRPCAHSASTASTSSTANGTLSHDKLMRSIEPVRHRRRASGARAARGLTAR